MLVHMLILHARATSLPHSQDVFSSSAELASLARLNTFIYTFALKKSWFFCIPAVCRIMKQIPFAIKRGFYFMELLNWCFRLELEYVTGLENLAKELEREADIIRGFLAKNYGHFDSRFWEGMMLDAWLLEIL